MVKNSRSSIRIRFLTTLTANLIRIAISFVTGLIIARALGPQDYGNFSFLLGSFTAFATLVDMGSASAFFTFISQNLRGPKFFFFYSAWIFIQFLALLLLVLLLPTPLKDMIWLGQSLELILLALFTSFGMSQLWRYLSQMGESIRDTVGVQVRNVLLSVSYLVGVLVLVGFNLLTLRVIFILNILLYFLFSGLYGLRLYKSNITLESRNENLKVLLLEFKNYCLPLVVYNWVGFFYTFADYWLLQNFGGAVQQGYYAIGARFANLSLIATTSMLQVMWKEVAEAHALENPERVRQLYDKITKSLYFTSALLSCLFIPFSREILTLLLGSAYQSAWLALAIMFFYPIQQSLGQITGTMLYALGQTKTKSCIGLAFMAVSIPAAYAFLAPSHSAIPGLQLGAVGLSVKMVLCALLEVNIMAYFVAKYVKALFDWRYQFLVIFILLALSFFSKFTIQWIFSLMAIKGLPLLAMVFSGLLYLGLTLITLCYVPYLAGLDTQQLKHCLFWLRERIMHT